MTLRTLALGQNNQPEKQSLLRSRRALEVATGIRFASLAPTIGPCIAIQESKESKGACTIRSKHGACTEQG
jgi:hypothetical protein